MSHDTRQIIFYDAEHEELYSVVSRTVALPVPDVGEYVNVTHKDEEMKAFYAIQGKVKNREFGGWV